MIEVTKKQAKRLHKAGFPKKDAKWHWALVKDQVTKKANWHLLTHPFSEQIILEHYPAPTEKQIIKRLGNNLREILCPYVPRRKGCNRPDYGIVLWNDCGNMVSHPDLTEALVRAIESVNKKKGKSKWRTE